MNSKWPGFVDALPLGEEIQSQLKEGYNVESVVDQGRRQLKILVHFDRVFPAGRLAEAEEVLTDYFSPYQARLQPFYPTLHPEELEELVRYLGARILREYPYFGEDTLCAVPEAREIRVTLPSDFHREVYGKRGIDRFLEEILRETLGNPGSVTVVPVHTEEAGERLSEIRDRERQAVLEHQQAMTQQTREGGGSGPSRKRSADAHVLYGGAILEEGIPAEAQGEAMKNRTFHGRIAGLESRTISGGKEMLTFTLASKRSGIPCKLFLKKGDEVPELKNGMMIKVRGNVELDAYRNAYTMMVGRICRYAPAPAVDDAQEKRVELHLHTKMSFLDANIELKDLFAKMKELGHDTVALTDHGVVQIYPEAQKLSASHGIKVLYGVEGYLFDDTHERDLKGRTNHVILLVKNQSGLKNLYRLISESHINHFYRRPRIPKSLLREHREGLVVGSACEAGEFFRAVVEGAGEEKLAAIADFYDYLEIQPVTNNEYMIRNGVVDTHEQLRDFNRRVVEIGRKTGKPVVATGDVHFLEKDDSIYRAILMKSKGYADVSQPELYYRTTGEMLAEFAYLGEETAYEVVVRNPRDLADSIEEVRPIPSGLNTPRIEGAEGQVREITLKQAHALYGDPLPELVRARLDRELDSIIGHGFAVLYLIAHKLVKKSNDDGYVVGSRGSVGSSLVATMMGITEVNPLIPHYRCPSCRHSEFIDDEEIGCGVELPARDCPVCGTPYAADGFNIPFETFLGFKGDKVPDIDLNFSGEYQPRIHKYTEELFGKGNVFKAGTISTVAEKTAAGYVRKYFEEENLGQPGEAEIGALASGCVGVKRTTGQHPGGLVIVPEYVDVLDFTPVQRPADDVHSDITTTHFDYHSIDDCLVKLDLLGHDDPTLIKYLEEMTGLSPKDIPLGDEGVMSLFRSPERLELAEKDFVETGSLGLPEFGTSFVRKMLLDTKPLVFSDLIRISGFSHGTDVWLNNAKDLILGGKVQLKEAISTRDDIMVYLQHKGLEDINAFKIMEDVRKGKKLKPEYMEDMTAHKVPQWYIDSCNKISYMFPKAHATAYVIMAVRLGWFKVYRKEAFYAAYFSVRGDAFDFNLFRDKETIRANLVRLKNEAGNGAKEKELRSLLELAFEMHLRGVTFAPISLYESGSRRFGLAGNTLIPPFSAIPGLGEKAADSILREREQRPFLSVEDLKRRCRVNNTLIEEMRKLGILEGLPESEQLSLFS